MGPFENVKYPPCIEDAISLISSMRRQSRSLGNGERRIES